MKIKDVIRKGKHHAKREFQVKIKGEIKESDLLKIGAKRVGSIIHEDSYFIPFGKPINEVNELIRVRKEGDSNFMFTYKGPVANRKMRNRIVFNKPITEKSIREIRKEYKKVINVNKERTIFILDSIVIHLYKVENLGNFVEFEALAKTDHYKIEALIKNFKLDNTNSSTLSYFELVVMNLSPIQRIFLKIHERFGKFAFGISSAVLTTIGIIMGMNSATSSLIAVVSGIAVVATADSLSDAIGMYASKKSERGISATTAFRSALNVFLGKAIFSATFIIPFMVFSFSNAISASIIWGLLLLTFVNIQIAFIQEENIPLVVTKNLFVAIIVMALSYFVGKGISLLSI
tara:strand:+ start:43 stop:1083 length:1041 start_codon:yes stop_codon:yes gene_type:complete